VTSGEDLRGLMRFVPHPVAVLSVRSDRDTMGVTVSSLVSLSLEPPLVGVSIGKQASVYGLLRNAGVFSLSILGDGQEDLARRFASGHPPLVHWSGVETTEGRHAPLLAGALGWLEARTIAEHDAGDHTFFIAAVESVSRGPAASALMYRDRSYHSL
jgi:3-hydroxy-9,10-secoandrosta-1,3,5(10)-triene-9,17-dione monooxygenase reductase component